MTGANAFIQVALIFICPPTTSAFFSTSNGKPRIRSSRECGVPDGWMSREPGVGVSSSIRHWPAVVYLFLFFKPLVVVWSDVFAIAMGGCRGGSGRGICIGVA